MLPLDYYSLGYCIAHSKCQWVLSLYEDIGEEEVRMLMAGASTRPETSSRVGLREVGLCKPLSISAESLNMLFTQWKSVLHLRELHLNLPVPCDDIPWPDLSGLRVLNLGIKSEMNWRLESLLPHLSLESLAISCTGDGGLVFEDCVAIALHIKSTTCVKELCVTHYVAIDDKGMEVISKALSDNQSLPLERLELICYGTFTNTAADCLAQFITNTATLQYLTIDRCTFSAHGLLALVQALHHNSTLQEKSLYTLYVTVNGDNEADDCVQLLVEYPDSMVDNTDNIYLYCDNINDAGVKALAQALHHNSTQVVKYVSHDISDAEAVALAQALHHNSTLKELDLSYNRTIDKDAIHQLVQALTVNTSITEDNIFDGVVLPMWSKEYATQCTQYDTVKDRIQFQ